MAPDAQLQPLRTRLRAALVDSMKAGDRTAVGALRSALGAIDNAEAVDQEQAPTATSGVIAGAVRGLGAGEVARRHLSEDEITEVVRTEVAERHAAAAEAERLGRPDSARRLHEESAVLTVHLA